MQMNARDEQLKRRWNDLIERLSDLFSDADALEMEGVLYLIGLQELGKFIKTSKKTTMSISFTLVFVLF